MPHAKRTRDYLDVAAGHLRIAIDDGELSPVDAVMAESLLIGWKRDRRVLTGMIDKETP